MCASPASLSSPEDGTKGARAFDLASLSSLGTFKTGCVTTLHFLCLTMRSTDDNFVKEFRKSLEHVHEAAGSSPSGRGLREPWPGVLRVARGLAMVRTCRPPSLDTHPAQAVGHARRLPVCLAASDKMPPAVCPPPRLPPSAHTRAEPDRAAALATACAERQAEQRLASRLRRALTVSLSVAPLHALAPSFRCRPPLVCVSSGLLSLSFAASYRWDCTRAGAP